MPLVVNREEERAKILQAFEQCLEERPIFSVSLRDIAKKAHMTHPKLLNYFQSKDELVLAYCDYIKDFMSQHCRAWFAQNSPQDYPDKRAYLNAFMRYVAEGREGERRPIATVQTYVLAKYNADVDRMVKEEFLVWKALMRDCLTGVFGEAATDADAERMMVLIAGVFICSYNGVLSGQVNDTLIPAPGLPGE